MKGEGDSGDLWSTRLPSRAKLLSACSHLHLAELTAPEETLCTLRIPLRTKPEPLGDGHLLLNFAWL